MKDQDGSDVRKLLICRDRSWNFTFCHVVKCNDTGVEKIVKHVFQSIRETGCGRQMTSCRHIITEREHTRNLQNPLAYDPQADGEAQQAVPEVKAQQRAIKLDWKARGR